MSGAWRSIGGPRSGCRGSGRAAATFTALRWYAGWLTREHVAPRAYEPREEDGENARLFAAGRVAMMTVSHAAVRDLRAAARHGLHLGFVPIPHRAGIAPVTVIYASAYAVPRRILGRKTAVELRSEERRVGKEWRSGW